MNRTIIKGRTLTADQRRVAFAVQDYLKANAGDSSSAPSSSPRGDGRWIPLSEAVPAGDAETVRRLNRLGILAAYEVVLDGEWLKAVPYERIVYVERNGGSHG